ncbi:integral membrane protein [Purpureocillium lavendulum]|uniref:Integral membrane protein n=1 Tax=Purpureocillium lavendulum TaxID=1247861 RepID=A0AB34FLF9_9HYPO|nr:integral membrane protein [Purpureocillium lavendulum]
MYCSASRGPQLAHAYTVRGSLRMWGGALALAVLLATGAHAHGDTSTGMDTAVGIGIGMGVGVGVDEPGHAHEQSAAVDDVQYPPTYFAHPDHSALIYAHIALMVLAWIFALPVAVMLSLAKSRYTVASQLLFSIIHAIGIFFSVIYNANTPDLYPNNAHHKIGWIATSVVSAQVFVSLVGWLAGATRCRHTWKPLESLSFIPISTELADDEYRISSDSGQGTEPNTESLRSNSLSTLDSVGDDEQDLPLHIRRKEYQQDDELADTNPTHAASGWAAAKAATIMSSVVWRYLDLEYRVSDRIILPFGFIALTTGIIAFGRFFVSRPPNIIVTQSLTVGPQKEGPGIFSGLAHWIKGGVFFWLGLLTLGRWSGSFGELGWAWNVRPRARHHQKRTWRPSAEFAESALILFYGSTNIFLEHLGGWGGDWSSQDLEHMAITVLFIGGGLCGILVESTRIRDLLNTTVVDAAPAESLSDEEHRLRSPPATYEFSLNPIPALVILLLGVMMSSHHQSTTISTMVHKQWGNLLLGASFARGLTYVLVFLRPPKSVLPSRPPTELLAAFGLIAGGIIFMVSSSDTIDGMIHYNLDAMFMYTVTMGLVGMLMAWEVVVLAIKGWATRREQRDMPRFAYA